jgi:BMFP domain-containing protein YqiC
MPDPKIFEELCTRLSTLIAASPAADIEKNVRALLSGFFARLDLINREEFDVQARVLQRTREKLDALEERVARLEEPIESAEFVEPAEPVAPAGTADAE